MNYALVLKEVTTIIRPLWNSIIFHFILLRLLFLWDGLMIGALNADARGSQSDH